MGLIILTIVMALLSCGAIIGSYIAFFRRGNSRTQLALNELLGQITLADNQIAELLKSKDSFIGPGQFDSIAKQLGEIQATLEAERASLKQIEERLDSAQKLVEKKEAEQQEIKNAKEEDLIKLEELLVNYGDVSRESHELEQRLASSLKSLDKILSEVELSQSQREMLISLQQAVELAGSRLRDLLTEYETVHERLTMLKQQHADLEEEYTRLVEQQLGE
jgi:chromosome segregation ATPase